MRPMCSALTWVYPAVVRMEVWQSKAWITRMSVPASSKCVAKLCLRMCGVTRLERPTDAAAFLRTLRTV